MADPLLRSLQGGEDPWGTPPHTHWAHGLTFSEVLQLLMWWSSWYPLGLAEEATGAAFSSLHHLFWTYGIVFVLRLGHSQMEGVALRLHNPNSWPIWRSGQTFC